MDPLVACALCVLVTSREEKCSMEHKKIAMGSVKKIALVAKRLLAMYE